MKTPEARGMVRYLSSIIFIFASIILLISDSSKAQWTDKGAPVCTVQGWQLFEGGVSDMCGGAFIVWTDYRNGSSNTDIYCQRIDSNGYRLWDQGGVIICNAAGGQSYADLINDDSGGAIIVWEDNRGGDNDIYAQRVDGSGNSLWADNGIPICTAPDNQWSPRIMSDGHGGAFIAWADLGDMSGENSPHRVYVQRVDSTGALLWNEGGVVICTVSSFEPSEVEGIVSDGSGGAIIVWTDHRTGEFGRVYLQRVDADGNPLWQENGVRLSTKETEQSLPDVVPYKGGAIVACAMGNDVRWYEFDIYVQRIDSTGSRVWGDEGVPICVSSQWWARWPSVALFDTLGAMITWYDIRTDAHVYAQFVNTDGIPQWTDNGITICNNKSSYPHIVSLGDAAIIVWRDGRDSSDNIYAQKIGIDGTIYWQDNGIPIYEHGKESEISSIGVIPHQSGEMIISWDEGRPPDYELDLFAAKLLPDGTLPVPTLLKNHYVSVEGGTVVISWVFSYAIDDAEFMILRSSENSPNSEPISSPEITRVGDSFSFVDRSCKPGMKYSYTVLIREGSGYKNLFEMHDIEIPPMRLTLFQNHPNPFNPNTSIRYYLPQRSVVDLRIYSASGELVRTLESGQKSRGSHEAIWDGKDDRGRGVSSGVYFYTLRAGKRKLTKKMVLLK